MEIKDAYKKAGPDDILKREIWKLSAGIRAEDFHKKNIDGFSALANDWEIIPPEPEILTAGESFDNEYGDEYCGTEFKKGYMGGFKNGHQNGRLERDLELRPVIEVVQEFFTEDSSKGCDDVRDMLANLPPLSKND